jgi:hypothetical protein
VIEVSYQLGDQPTPELCVRVGTEIRITLRGPNGYRWTPVTSSNEQIAALVSSVGGSVGQAQVRAVAVGGAVLRATTSFTADPYGPPTRLWQVTVRVES